MAVSTTISLVGGLDIGNGYVKGVIENRDSKALDEIDIPSGVSIMMVDNKLPVPDEDAVEVLTAEGNGSIYNQLDASFETPLVAKNYRRLFGQRGLSAAGTFEQFDVDSRQSKAEQELSKILVLGLFAAKAIKDYVSMNGGLPEQGQPLQVNAVGVLALPIAEYVQFRKHYARDFTNTTHMVTIHIFETPVTVLLTFLGVDVLPEGASAQFAISDKGEPLAAMMLADVRRHTGGYEDITPADVVAATNTVGVDIGEGTVNFPIFTDKSFNRDASTSMNKGYGSVLSLALRNMEANHESAGFDSRKQLANFMLKPPSMKKNVYNRVKGYVDNQAELFTDEVAREFGRVMSAGGIGASTEAVYVYGGGAGAVKEMLYPKLLAKAKEINGEDAPVILYLDPAYSRHLNREGLFIAARAVASKFFGNLK